MTAYCFDLDGTLTKAEILPMIAKEIGLYEEIAALTDATIKGILPFNSSFSLRCRLLNEVSISRVNEIILTIPMYENILKFIEKNPENCFVITGNLDVWISSLKDKIKCKFYSSSASCKENHICSVNKIIDKGEIIKLIRTQGYNKIISIGDGMGDVSMFQESDIGIAFGETHSPVQSLIEYSNYIVYKEESLCNLLNTL